MRKKLTGILVSSILTMSVLFAGVQASAENGSSGETEVSVLEEDKDRIENTENETDTEAEDENEEVDLTENEVETEEPDKEQTDKEQADKTEEDFFEEPEEETDVVQEDEEQEVVLEPGEDEEVFSDDAGDEKVSRAGSNIVLQRVDATYRMREEYAFTYAFRKGVTELSYISRHNKDLNGKLHNWFGDEKGYTEAYCETFYGCKIDDDTYTDPITAIYSNVGEYQGKIVDLRVTVPSWGPVNKNHVGKDGKKIIPCVTFYKNRIAFNTIAVGVVKFKFEFLEHGTEKKIFPKGHTTAADLDGGQGIRIYDSWGVDRIYLRKGYSYLKVKSGSNYQEIKSEEKSESLNNNDVRGWCHLDFNGSFTLNWLSQETWKTGTGLQNAFYVSTGQTVGTYEPNPAPEKRVGDEGSSYASMSRHEFTRTDPPYEITEGKKFDYVISQRVLPGTYSSFEVSDTLDSCLDYLGAKVTTSLGNDVTDKFQIKNNAGKIVFTANSGFLKTDESYNNVTYYFRIKVKAKSNREIEAHDHYQKSKEFYSIKNTASRTIVSDKMNDTQKTNEAWVKGTTDMAVGEIVVTKKIKEADITWAHGNPVFRFQIRGTDNRGIPHLYENYVEFEPHTYQVNGEDAVMSCMFKGIPEGRYTVSELPTLRYQFESVSAETANVSIAEKTGIVSISAGNSSASVTFKNKKTRYDRYSHTDVIRNVIPVSGKLR